MGWWSPKGNDNIIVGDEVFDKTYHYLEELAALYRESHGRSMTVDELATILSGALQNHGGPETFEGVDELEVSSVTIKTKKRAKRPRLQVGDVFVIPLEPGRWGFGRIVNLERSWHLVEVFAYVSSEPRYTSAAVAAGRLLPPIPIDTDEAFVEGAGRWRVVHSQPGFKLEDLDKLEYATGNYQILRVNAFVPETPTSLAHAMELPRYKLVLLEDTEEQIRAALRARGLLDPKPAP
jgi:hypothetical protein